MSENKALLQRLYNKLVYNPEARSIENPQYPITSQTIIDLMGGQEQESGVSINPDSALTIAAYHRANEVLNHTIASLPLSVYEKQKDGSSKKIDHDLNFILKREANPLMSAFTAKELGQGQLNTNGNYYARIKRNGSGIVTSLWPEVDGITPIKNNDRVVYKPNDGRDPIKYDDMFHVHGFGFNGLVGKPKIQIMAESLGLGLAYQKYASRFIKNDATAKTVLIAKGGLTEDQKKQSKKNWQESQGGSNQGGTAVITGDWDLKNISSTPSDSQLLESRQFSVTEISRWTGVPPHLLFDLNRATYNNIEHQMIEFVMFTILGWCTKWEHEYNRKLFTERDRRANKYFVKHNLSGLMRADAKSRAELYKALSGVSAFSANDILKLEDMNPVEGGEKRYTQMQNVPVDRIDEYMDAIIKKGSNGTG